VLWSACADSRSLVDVGLTAISSPKIRTLLASSSRRPRYSAPGSRHHHVRFRTPQIVLEVVLYPPASAMPLAEMITTPVSRSARGIHPRWRCSELRPVEILPSREHLL